jgi:hypothetical protein
MPTMLAVSPRDRRLTVARATVALLGVSSLDLPRWFRPAGLFIPCVHAASKLAPARGRRQSQDVREGVAFAGEVAFRFESAFSKVGTGFASAIKLAQIA